MPKQPTNTLLSRSADFWDPRKVFTLRNLVAMGMLMAICVVIHLLTTVWISPIQKVISLSYLPGLVVAAVYGPWAAMAFGFLSDILKFFAAPNGDFFIGYAISELVTLLIYSLWLYRRPVVGWQAVCRLAIARVLVIGVVYFGLNFIWARMTYGALAAKFFTTTRLVNNLVQFPAHVALSYGLLVALQRIPQIKRLLPPPRQRTM